MRVILDQCPTSISGSGCRINKLGFSKYKMPNPGFGKDLELPSDYCCQPDIFKCKLVNITRKNNKTVQNLWSRAVMGRECLEMDVCFGWTAATNDREQRRWRLKDAQDASLAIDHTSMPVASSTNHLCCALAALFESHALSLECKDPRRLSSRDNLKFIHLPNGTF